jgi:hypothetical protein
VFDDGSGPKLFAGGRFDSIGGNAIAGFARWDGTSWSAVHVDTSDGFQAAISFDDDGDGTPELFLGSSSPTIGSLSSGFVARLYRTTCCSGGVTSYCTAGTTTNGCNAVMSSSGTPSATASSGFTLTASNVEGQKTGLLFYGASGPKASVWAPGSASFLCVKSPVQRTPSASSGGTADACDGALSIDWLDYLATHPGALGNPFSAGAGVWAQAWFRDPPAPGTTNLSDGLTWTMCP